MFCPFCSYELVSTKAKGERHQFGEYRKVEQLTCPNDLCFAESKKFLLVDYPASDWHGFSQVYLDTDFDQAIKDVESRWSL